MTTPQAESASRTLADLIRSAIMRGEYVPQQRLVELDLSEQYQANRSTVRLALQELAKDGLVEIMRHRGAKVRSVSPAEAIEITEVRAVLEGLSAAKAADRVTEAQADDLLRLGAEMRAAVEAGDFERYSNLNAALHAAVRNIAQHHTSEAIITRLGAQVVRYQYGLSRRPGRPAVSLEQHERIISTIVARDPEAAAQAMQEHLRSVASVIAEAEGDQIENQVWHGFKHLPVD